MNIGILGTGNMGRRLGQLWAEVGHRVCFGSRDPEKARALAHHVEAESEGGTYAEAVEFGDVIVLAVPWISAESTLKMLGPLSGKILLDITNPWGETPDKLSVGHLTSGAEMIARWVPEARVVKAFNHVFCEILDNPYFLEGKASLFYCGDDASAKTIIANLGHDIGFDPFDSGPLTSARMLEPLAALWVTLAFDQGVGRNSAFALLRRNI